MLGRRHRRSLYTYSASEQKRGGWMRVLIAGVALIILWFVGSTIISLFNGSIVKRTSATLRIEQAYLDNVLITVQGGESQKAENNVKVYAGDTILTKMGGIATVTFFDGTSIRLDEATELTVAASQQSSNDEESHIESAIQTGRVWVHTPAASAFSGAIVRTLSFPEYTATLTPETQAIFSPTNISVVKASGLGMTITLKNAGKEKSAILGEGQMLSLTDDAIRAIAAGESVYEYRDPLTQQVLRDPFLVKSYALSLQESETNEAALVAGNKDLTVQTPKNNDVVTGKTVRVSGSVGSRIKTLTVNGYSVSIAQNGAFSTELNIGDKANVSINIEGQDEQGITIAQEELNVTAAPLSPAKSLKITSPASAGETYTTNDAEFELTGEANADTKSVVVNGYTLQLYKPGSRTWSYLLSTRLGNLVQGKNVLTVYGIDSQDRKTEPATLTIIYDPSGTVSVSGGSSSSAPLKQNAPLTPGILSVEKPVSGLSGTTKEKEVLIEGKTSSATDSVYVNGYRLSLYQAGKDFWNYIASVDLGTMKDGKNIYRIVSRNAEGEILDVLEYTLTKE